MRVVVLIAAAWLSLGSVQRPAVTQSYDRFTGASNVGVRDISAGDNLIMDAYTEADSSVVTLDFHTVVATSTWQYLKCHRVDLLADGVVVPVIRTRHDGETGQGYRGADVTETVYASVNVYEFKRWAAGSVVVGRVCDNEFVVSGQDLANLKNFAARF